MAEINLPYEAFDVYIYSSGDIASPNLLIKIYFQTVYLLILSKII